MDCKGHVRLGNDAHSQLFMLNSLRPLMIRGLSDQSTMMCIPRNSAYLLECERSLLFFSLLPSRFCLVLGWETFRSLCAPCNFHFCLREESWSLLILEQKLSGDEVLELEDIYPLSMLFPVEPSTTVDLLMRGLARLTRYSHSSLDYKSKDLDSA